MASARAERPTIDSPEPTCSIAATLGIIGDRWSLLILRDVFRGARRFSEIQTDLGIAKNLLSDRLSGLVGYGVLERVPYQDRPVRHEYRLTRGGNHVGPSVGPRLVEAFRHLGRLLWRSFDDHSIDSIVELDSFAAQVRTLADRAGFHRMALVDGPAGPSPVGSSSPAPNRRASTSTL